MAGADVPALVVTLRAEPEAAPAPAGTFMYHAHHDEMTQIALG